MTTPRPSPELIESVRHYVHFDNLAESLTKQVTNARTLRSEYETKVLTLLDNTGMRNAVLQINGATLQRSSKTKPTDLSWTFLEENLHAYYKAKGKPDETTAILEFIQQRRGAKTVEFLKKTSAEPAGKKTPAA
jgi:hypothetical protein